jgi:exosortase/archaeosortase family protein
VKLLFAIRDLPGFKIALLWAVIASFTGAWMSLLFRMSLWWNEASYYTHGWAVPLLLIILIIYRMPEEESVGKSFNSLCPILISLFLYFPARLVGEPDPFWRFPLWVETVSLCWLTGFLIRQTKLKISWQTWSLISFYLLTALPWPAGLESRIVHGLTQVVSELTTESLLLLGFPAILSQGAILVDQDLVKINQACSGIRSLQNLISLGVFLSIYFRFEWGRFAFLIFMSCLSTLFFNFWRALALSYLSLEFGAETQKEWHDFVGNSIVTFSMLTVGFIGWAMSTKTNSEKILSNHSLNQTIISFRPISGCVFLGVFTLPQVITIFWFSLLCPKPPAFSWDIDLGESAEKIEQGVEDVLQFDYGEKKKFSLGPNAWVEVIHFGYNQQSAAASLCSRNHPPDYCMGYTGVKIVESNPEVTFDFEGTPLVFRHYSSPQQISGIPGIDVFWGSFTLDSRIASFEFENSSIVEKVKWFLSGKLSYERKVLLITLNGVKNKENAADELFSLLSKILIKSNS